jgi:Na+/H+ antiporter NhaC
MDPNATHPYGWLSLLPPILAIGLAIVSRRVLLSLFSGVFVGALLYTGGDPLQAIPATMERYLWTSLSDGDHLRVFTFTLLMGAMVGVMQVSRGMQGIVETIAPWARSRRGGHIVVWSLGLIVFFDDYANSLLLGNTMRPLTDRLRISREKLAYLVDSTAAPVSGLAIISTWIAGEIGYIQDGFQQVGLGDQVDGFAIFVATIPARFYVLWALLFVPLVGLLGRDFGPMLRAERSALAGTDRSSRAGSSAAAKTEVGKWQNAIVPVLVTILVTLALILQTGQQTVTGRAEESVSWMTAFGLGDSYLALVYGSLCGLISAICLPLGQRMLSWPEIREAAFQGARGVLPALAILCLAWALSDVTSRDLGTGQFLGHLLQDTVSMTWMPTLVFLLAAFVAFATGTSWGTMGVLMPLVIQTCYQMSAEPSELSPHDPLLLGTVAGVLAGAIFGDHCSPISDTTVLSSQASGCNHIAHVTTQLPYALLVAGVSVLCGTIPLGMGISAWWLLPLGPIVLIACLLLIGRRVRE